MSCWRRRAMRSPPGDVATLRLVLNSQHAVDLADLLRRLDDGDRKHSLGLLAESLAAGVLAEFDVSTLVSVAAQLDDRALSGIVEQMAPDDAADVLADLSEEHSERILSLMAHGEAQVVRELMKHPEDSGGGIMTSRLVSVAVDATVADAVDHLRARAGESMGAIADREPITVRADMDQEEIAEIFADYDLLAMPIVDAHGTLVGQVTVDDIVDVIQEEATEDNLKMAATSSEEMEDRSVFGVMRHRLPWLLFCLLGTLLSGGVLDLFSGVLATLSPLVLFVPAIMAMGGNSGIQTSTVTVRSLATGILLPEEVYSALWRELRVAALMGTFLGLVVFAVAYVWTDGSAVAPCAGIAMFAAVVLSAVLGATIPILFRAFGIDPAVASGPLITTVNDILSLSIYFGVASALLQLMAAG